MNLEPFEDSGPPAIEPDAPVPTAPQAAGSSTDGRRIRRAGAVAATILVGAGALIALLGPLSVNAQSPSPDPSAAVSGTTGSPGSTGTTGASGTIGRPDHGPGGRGGMRGLNETVSDTSVAAKAIGISEADLLTALQSGKTIADVAKANSVDPQKVIDALVQDGNDELAAAVKAGTITQAQADAEQANVTQRATDQVNGTFRGGPGGRGGMGGPGGPHGAPRNGAPSNGGNTGGTTSGG